MGYKKCEVKKNQEIKAVISTEAKKFVDESVIRALISATSKKFSYIQPSVSLVQYKILSSIND